MTAKANNSVARASVTRFIGNLPCIIEVVGRRGPPTAASIVSPAGPFQDLTGPAGGGTVRNSFDHLVAQVEQQSRVTQGRAHWRSSNLWQDRVWLDAEPAHWASIRPPLEQPFFCPRHFDWRMLWHV